MSTTFDGLRAIRWPDEFTVEYTNGAKERLLRGAGVIITPPADDPEGIGDICAELPKKHPRNQGGWRCVRFDELRAIYAQDGRRLWPGTEPAPAA